jgi:ubiquinone/menaquinone biosynthesis C-methylase UbiE
MPISYDRLACRYEKTLEPLEKWFLTDLRKEALASLPEGARILELGAGTGLNFMFYHSGTHGAATEPSTEMIRIAKTKQKPQAMHLVQNFAERLPFQTGSFDAALATLVMCSVRSPEQVFAELCRVIKRGGTISLVEHVRPNGLLGWMFDLLNLVTVPLVDDHVNRRTAQTAREAGLQVTKVRKVGFGIINVITCVV